MTNLIDPSLIKVGAVLKTRDGYKVRILCTDRKGPRESPVIGLLDKVTYECTIGFQLDGTCNYFDYSSLVSVWTEPVIFDWSVIPKWFDWIARDAFGVWESFSEMPSIKQVEWSSNYGETITIPLEYAPKWTGDWNDSLTKRP